MTSPSGNASHDAHRLLKARGPATWATQAPSNYSSPDIDRQQAFACRESSSTAEADILSRARSFLVDYGQFSADQVLRPELLLKLASMMVELESQQALKQEVQVLKAENSALQNENATLKAFSTARLQQASPSSTHHPLILLRSSQGHHPVRAASLGIEL
jgi:hypothetical protein